jgi:hypothetical protein
MKRRIMNFRAVISFTVLAISTLLVGRLAGSPCPGPNKVPQRDGTYDFTYESWIRKYQHRDHWDFGRCVENRLSTLDMLVDWRGTGVKGWARPNDRVDAGIESPNRDYDLIGTDLWYGSGPRRIDSQYRAPKPQKRAGPGTASSYVYMAIPANLKRPAETLVSIEVEFLSAVEETPEGFRYRYQWSDSLATDRAPVRFRWDALSKLLSAVGKSNFEQHELTAEKSDVSFVSKAPPAYDIALMELLDSDGETAVGTTPIATYHPSDVDVPQLPTNEWKK